MGRRKIEIKAIKDDRNRSVTFLKRKGGLFKKAHELSVLCSVDVAVFVFGNNKKLYEYSSADMRDLIARYQFHAGPSEHKGPSDFNGGNEDDEELDGTPPRGHEGLGPQMMPPQYHGQPQAHYPPVQVRHHTPSASPPMPNGGAVFNGHPHPHPHAQQQQQQQQQRRSHTPQGSVGSRPVSRNDGRRLGPNMAHQAPHPGITYMPTPPIYNPAQGQSGMAPQPGSQYPYPAPAQQPQQPQQPPQQPAVYMEERRPSGSPAYTGQQPPPQAVTGARVFPSPQPAPQQIPAISTTPPQPENRPREPQPPPPVEPKTEPRDRPQPPQPPLLNTDSAIKKLPQRKSHSIFTPIEENRSILSQHLESFTSETPKTESAAAAAAANANSRTQSADNAAASRTSSPPPNTKTASPEKGRTISASSIPETTFTPPSRSNSFKTGPAAARPRGPRLTVQIPGDGGSEAGSAAAESNSPRPADPAPQRHNSHSSIVLPPPSPSASALLSAGATGPPNPFAKPPPQQNVNAESTPASALPSRFLGNDFLPSPGSFYADWNFRASDNNTMPSPLNFATPVGPSGPSFLREEHATTTAAAGSSTTATAGAAGKRKSPEFSEHEHAEGQEASGDAKRVKVE
ncbi:Transcription factor-like protein [Hapsidospora chrysogenum ATCC 11550]|uniref:MADS-box MEF2 type transcription factor MIG1 n=1 Tax=Hapsidospora chrysogenum (strain ATCC 11550 / CBS 779.69 / DSM 880 / IAM 14645 / JCM 23072 / IMI 49137) TaxID=857340 RepID=A0A086T508_HAPC1|nr:Transcription factor-like protein [Hapsidospora chrysogenum ATCC 11550]